MVPGNGTGGSLKSLLSSATVSPEKGALTREGPKGGTAAFKAKVALAAFKSEKTLAEFAEIRVDPRANSCDPDAELMGRLPVRWRRGSDEFAVTVPAIDTDCGERCVGARNVSPRGCERISVQSRISSADVSELAIDPRSVGGRSAPSDLYTAPNFRHQLDTAMRPSK